MSDEKQQSPEEQGFNDSELQDIMEEIESLEKEFSGDAPSGEGEVSETPEEPEAKPEAKKEESDDRTDLQKAIDKEVEGLEMESNMDEMEKALDHAEDEDDVFSESDFEEESHAEVTPISSHRPHQQDMQLKASGPMNLELSFPVGEHKADFKVHHDGFSVEFNGVVVHIDEKKGCHISMPGGGEFSLPLEQSKVKKAS